MTPGIRIKTIGMSLELKMKRFSCVYTFIFFYQFPLLFQQSAKSNWKPNIKLVQRKSSNVIKQQATDLCWLKCLATKLLLKEIIYHPLHLMVLCK